MERPQIRELEYIVALADELSFTRAAARLGIAQPPLSRAISRFERRVGFRLFDRTSRAVSVTERGGEVIERSRAILDAVDDLVRHGTSTELVLALRAATGSGLVARILGSTAWSSNGIVVRIMFAHKPDDAVRRGRADIALMCDTNDVTGLTIEELKQQPTVALIRSTVHGSTPPATTLREAREHPGFTSECPDASLDEIVDLIAMTDLSVLASADVAERIGTGVVAVPVIDAPPTRLVLGWRQIDETAARDTFVAIARAVAHASRRRVQAS